MLEQHLEFLLDDIRLNDFKIRGTRLKSQDRNALGGQRDRPVPVATTGRIANARNFLVFLESP